MACFVEMNTRALSGLAPAAVRNAVTDGSEGLKLHVMFPSSNF